MIQAGHFTGDYARSDVATLLELDQKRVSIGHCVAFGRAVSRGRSQAHLFQVFFGVETSQRRVRKLLTAHHIARVGPTSVYNHSYIVSANDRVKSRGF